MNGTQLDAVEHNIHIHDYIMRVVLFSIVLQQSNAGSRFKIKTIKNSAWENT